MHQQEVKPLSPIAAGFGSGYPCPDQRGACSPRALPIVPSAPPVPSIDPGI
jgi:hypothetical protein